MRIVYNNMSLYQSVHIIWNNCMDHEGGTINNVFKSLNIQ